MNKKLLAAFAASAVLGVAVAGATPQTTFTAGQTQLDLGAWDVKAETNVNDVNVGTSAKWNFMGGLTHAISDKTALQYEYHGLNTGDISGTNVNVKGNEHEVNLVQSLNDNFAVYGGWNRIHFADQTNNVAQLGLVAKAELAKNLDIYGRAAIGTAKTTLWEAGLGYGVTKDLDIQAGYRYLNTKATDDQNVTFKGPFAGLSYRFGGESTPAPVVVEPTPAPVVTPAPTPVHEVKDYYLQSIYFDVDSSAIRPSEAPKVEAFAQAVKAYPQNAFKVVGNTDGDASGDYNMALSKDRVNAVEQYAANRGANTNQMISVYNGEYKPAATNATAQGKAENRRVDVFIVK